MNPRNTPSIVLRACCCVLAHSQLGLISYCISRRHAAVGVGRVHRSGVLHSYSSQLPIQSFQFACSIDLCAHHHRRGLAVVLTRNKSKNIFIGPAISDLVAVGAMFAPCGTSCSPIPRYYSVLSRYTVLSQLRAHPILGTPCSPIRGTPCSPILGTPCSPIIGIPCSLNLGTPCSSSGLRAHLL